MTLRTIDIAGRDAKLPNWLGADIRPGRPKYDSVVVRGNGIGALVFAGRLARSAEFEGRVALAGPAVSPNRRLIGGLTLRCRALDYYSAALGIRHDELLGRLFAGSAARAATLRQLGSYCVADPTGGLSLLRRGQWLSSEQSDGRPLAYGVRNSHLASTLGDIVRELGVTRSDGPSDTVENCRAIALGQTPLIVNAGPRPLVAKPASPTSFVAAVQHPLAGTLRKERGVLEDGSSLFTARLRKGRNDIGIFNPLVDPLSPTADYYGIVYRLIAATPDVDRERELATLRDELGAICNTLGFTSVDPDETEGAAFIPCSPWNHQATVQDGVLELARVYDAGAPIITGDGMTRAGLSGLVAAEAILAGQDPIEHANRALARWRQGNRMLAAGMTWAARLAALGIRLAPGPVLAQGAMPDTWAGIALPSN